MSTVTGHAPAATISNSPAFHGANDAFGICPRWTNERAELPFATGEVRLQESKWRGAGRRKGGEGDGEGQGSEGFRRPCGSREADNECDYECLRNLATSTYIKSLFEKITIQWCFEDVRETTVHDRKFGPVSRWNRCGDSVYGVFENVIGVTAQSPCEYLNKYPKLHAMVVRAFRYFQFIRQTRTAQHYRRRSRLIRPLIMPDDY